MLESAPCAMAEPPPPAVPDAPSPPAPVDPPGTALEPAERALARGDHRELRRLLPAIRARATADSRERVEQLERAVRVDPFLIGVLSVCALALLAVLLHYLVP